MQPPSIHRTLSARETLTCAAVFEESVNFDRTYTLPFNTLVAILEDGGMDNSPIRNLLSGETKMRQKNWIYFTPCAMPVLYVSRPNLHYIAIHFSLELYPGIDVFAREKHWIFEYSPEGTERLEQAFHTENPQLAASRVREFCLWFCNGHWPDSCMIDPRCNRYDAVLRHISAHISARMTVAELAGMMHLRPEVFSREFSELFGKSPKDFLENELASRAASLLRNAKHSVKETAAALDFSSEFYFSKFFRRRIGCAPSEYSAREK